MPEKYPGCFNLVEVICPERVWQPFLWQIREWAIKKAAGRRLNYCLGNPFNSGRKRREGHDGNELVV